MRSIMLFALRDKIIKYVPTHERKKDIYIFLMYSRAGTLLVTCDYNGK